MASFRIDELGSTVAVLLTVCVVASACLSQEIVTPPTTQTTTPHTHTDLQVGPYLGNYSISDAVFGTQTTVTVSGDARTIVTNALPNHETGVFPNSGNPNSISAQSDRYEYPANPIYRGTATEVHVPGVAVNGVKFEPGTAETVTCATGETYRVEGLQDTFNLGMDFNNAHVQPTGAYHYHGLSDLLAEMHAFSGGELVHVGFAADGYLMYISITNAYASSYRLSAALRAGSNCKVSLGGGQGPNVVVGGTVPDGTYTSDWEYVSGSGGLDECNGTLIADQYVYIITNEFPYISRCLNGEFTETRPSGQQTRGQTGPTLGGPNLAVAATQLGVTERQLRLALGPPPPDIEAAAASLGVSASALRAALDGSR
ncbi:MAG: YHYH protein [Actinomycetota bacterium]